MTLGQRIKEKLREAGLSQKDLAEEIDLPQSTISDIIKDKFEPGINKVKAISKALDVDIAWLVTGMTAEEATAISGMGTGMVREPTVEYKTGIDAKIAIKLKLLEKEQKELVLKMLEEITKDKE